MLLLTTSNLEKLLLLTLLVAISEAARRRDKKLPCPNSQCPTSPPPKSPCPKSPCRKSSCPKSPCPVVAEKEWSYTGSNGPNHWNENYPNCNGKSQSTINIDTSCVGTDEKLGGLGFNNYDVPVSRATMKNNGHTIEVVPQDGVDRTISVDGETYRLTKLHFHWGCMARRGSEHTINGASESMELHLVHTTANEKIAVVGVLMHECFLTPNIEINKIGRQLGEVKYKQTETELKFRLNLKQLLPANSKSFYRYSGSLSTPPCSEKVMWSVMTYPTSVGMLQMTRFREMKSATYEDDAPGSKLCDNYRPVQPLGARLVTHSAYGWRSYG